MKEYVSTDRFAIFAFDGKIILRCEIDKPNADKLDNKVAFEYIDGISVGCEKYARDVLSCQLADVYDAHRASTSSRFCPYLYKVVIDVRSKTDDMLSVSLEARLVRADVTISAFTDEIIFNENGIIPKKLLKNYIRN